MSLEETDSLDEILFEFVKEGYQDEQPKGHPKLRKILAMISIAATETKNNIPDTLKLV